jgi:PAS domain S-box-containing protein
LPRILKFILVHGAALVPDTSPYRSLNASLTPQEKGQGAALPVDNLNHSWLGAVELAIAIGIAYFLAARLGLALRAQVGVAIFWPAAGIATGVLIALGPAARLPVTVAVAAGSMASGLLIGRNPWLTMIFVFLNVGEVLLTAWLVARWFAGVFKLEDVPHVLGFLVASAIAAGMGAAGAAIAISFVEPRPFSLDVLRIWFVAGLLGTVTVAPLIIGLREAVREPPPRRELLEGTMALTILAALSIFFIFLPQRPWATALPAAFVFSLLLCIAVRCRPVFIAAAMFIVALTVVWSITFNIGHFGDASIPLADRMLAAQTLVLVGVLLALVLAALFAERRRSEAALKQSKERLQMALDGAELGAFSADFTTGRYECDMRAAQIHGHNGPPMTIQESRRFVHPDDLMRIDAAVAEALRTGKVLNAQYRVVPPPNHLHAGEMRWIAAESSIVRNPQGTPVGLHGVTRDITHHKRAEQTLAERNAQIALAGRVALVGSYVCDFSTGAMQISEGYAAIHGLPEGTTETVLSQWWKRVHPEDLERVKKLRDQTFADQREESHIEYRIVRADGEVRWIERRSIISYNSEGRPQRIVGVSIDVTERKRAEEHQRVLVAELDHRVKNALATVNAVVSGTLHASGSAADFAAALVGRVQSMARAHSLLSLRRWRGISLVELIRREFAPYATRSNTEFNGPEILLGAEAGQAMAMVLHELVTNAAKHGALSSQSGRVLIRWDRQPHGSPRARLVVEWQEIDGPSVVAPTKSGYGTRIVRELIPYELGGSVDFAFATEGVRCRLEIPGECLLKAA